ncbi:DUF2946 domain-containing protein [Dyella silvatica]|uniref:DUF2946 domain-containing protein n=1 Tax=Dyella silvatica TaxID=2992128 RepID=UPI0022508D27|nr:DUF2946 domain-containing protein [Dyella silvatica]
MLAIWLTVIAPVVSRALPSSDSPDLGAWCMGHEGLSDKHASPSSPVSHPHDADHWERCGYCSLFSHSPTLSFTPSSLLLPAPSLWLSVWLPTQPAVAARPLFDAAPRGPPAISLS